MRAARSSIPLALLGACLLFALILLAPDSSASRASAGSTGGLVSEVVVSGLPRPVAFAFAPDGRIFVASLGGNVRIIKDGALLATPFVTLPANSIGERGLLGLALDPDFVTNGYVYLYYTHETNAADPQGPKTGRLIRVTANGDVAQPGSEVVLLGSVVGDASQPSCEDFPAGTDCIPADGLSHVGGALWFGPDAMLYLGTGDGAFFPGVLSPLAVRSQDVNSLAGKIVRINPDDGSAPPDNPFYTGDPTANRSKVWAHGFRQAFRVGPQPGTGLAFVGEVGSRHWEEINVVEPGQNYGWPCYEGTAQNPDAASLPECQALYASAAVVAHPVYSYPHASGAAVVGGAFYQGTNYPPEYQDAFFFGDWVRRTVSLLNVGGDDQLIPESVQLVFENQGGPVDFEMGPDGDMYYLTWGGAATGEVRRIRFVPGNRPPVAEASATPLGGLAPLTVQLSSDGSTDPDGQPLSYVWSFGDGDTSTAANPTHAFGQNGTYLAQLTVTDSDGAAGTDTVTIVVGNELPEAAILLPTPRTAYEAGEVIAFSGLGVDAEDGALVTVGLQWSVSLHHCFPASATCHAHPFLQQAGAGASLVAPNQSDELFFLELTLTATDSAGLADAASVIIGPDTDGDGLLDHEELLVLGTDWLDPDSDDDGTPDGHSDADGDGLLEYHELLILRTDPGDADSDDDGTPDSDEDADGDGCPNVSELGTNPMQGGRRDPLDPWDYFNPTGDGRNRIDDVVAVLGKYFQDRSDPGYSSAYDRTGVAGADPWNLGPPDGKIRVDDILAALGQYFNDCATS